MKAMSLKLKMYVGNANVVNNNIEKTLLQTILWSFGILGFLYILFLGNMVKNIVERRSFDAQAHSLSAEVGNLELTYLSLTNNIDLAFSHSLGFKESKPVFTTRNSLGYNSTAEIISKQNASFGNAKIVQNGL